MSENTAKTTSKSKPIRCVVTSDKMSKSRVGTVNRLVKDEQYHKFIKKRTKLMFHDEKNETKEGDVILIIPAKPRSCRKKFDLYKILQKAEG